MDSIFTLLFVLQVIVAIALIGFVLIQHGKGADAGAAFGSGSSSTVFGSRGSASFLTKFTSVIATLFIVCSVAIVAISRDELRETQSVLEKQEEEDSTLPQIPQTK